MDKSKALMAHLAFTTKELELIYDSVARVLTIDRENYSSHERDMMREILDVVHEALLED